MSQPALFSILESSAHPVMSDLYRQLGYEEMKFTSQRKAISKLKTTRPAVIVAEFFYGYGNNYAGVNVSNLDTLLASLQRYSPETRVIILVSKAEFEHVEKLQKLFPVHAVLVHPVTRADLEQLLKGD